jgi:6-phosphofructokinase
MKPTKHYYFLIKFYIKNYLQEVRRRGLKVAVAGIPKTIDNDIAVIFATFFGK